MIVEKGVEMIKVCENIKKILPIVDEVFYEHGNHLIIEATEWGRDNLRDSHLAGQAVDVKKPLMKQFEVFYKLKDVLGINYFVKSFEGHFHIGYAPGEETIKHIKKYYKKHKPAAAAPPGIQSL